MTFATQPPAAAGPSRASQPEHPQLAYCFTVDEMHSTEIQEDPRGDWLLPQSQGTNRKTQEYPLTFRFDGERTRKIDSIPEELVIYQTYSLYHADGRIWIVKYDATECNVGDGDPSEAATMGLEEEAATTGFEEEAATVGSEDEEARYRDVWVKLSFNSVEHDHTYLSYVGRRKEKKRLLKQRLDQLWATQYLPDAFQAARPAHYTTQKEHGGLVGDIALLIGLVAMSVPAMDVPHVLCETIVNVPGKPGSWNVVERARREGWSERRGLVVKVFHDEIKVPRSLLRKYEHGDLGKILP